LAADGFYIAPGVEGGCLALPDQDCLKLTSYFGERQRANGRPAANALLSLYQQPGITASVLLRGIQGFGRNHQVHTDRSLTLSEDLPLVTVAMGTRPAVEAALEQARALPVPGLITLERAVLLDAGAGYHRLPADLADEEAVLCVFCTSHDQVFAVPASEAICDLLHRRGISSAMAMQAVDGTVHGRRLHASFLGRQAEAPVMILAVGAREHVLRVIPEVGGLLRNPLMTVGPVRTCKRDGAFLAVPDRSPGTGEKGMARWQKLSVYAPETARHQGQPLHRVLLRRLLAADVSGVTTLRGIRGFHGDRPAPWHGGRRAVRDRPAVTVVMDTPERIPAAFAIVDEVTAHQGLVTSEVIAAALAAAELPG
jgi:PII-like signaling protein